MTTKMFDNKISRLSKFYCRGGSDEKKTFWTIFLSARKAPPPLKHRKFDFDCRLAFSEIRRRLFYFAAPLFVMS